MQTTRNVLVPRALALLLGASLSISNPAAAVSAAPRGHVPAAQPVLLLQPASLALPQTDAFNILGHSCGGIAEHPYMTGFDPASGFPTGAVRLSTTCSTGGIGGNTITYVAWAGVIWDFSGNVVSATALAGAPTVDPNFSAADAVNDVVYNSHGAAYLLVPIPDAPTHITVTQSSDEFHVSWTTRGVNPAAVASTTLTATPVGSAAPVLTATVNGPATNGVISTLQPQTTYSIVVVNTTLSGASSPSLPIVVTSAQATQPPGAPTSVTAHWTNLNPTGATDTLVATWHAPDSGNSPIDQYQVRIVASETYGTLTQTVSGTTLSASFVVDWNPDWSVSVQAHNAAGWGPWSTVFHLGGL